MPALARAEPLTADEYFGLEAASDLRHEYINGEMWCMACGSDWHNVIAQNAGGALRQAVRPRGCQVFQENVKLKVDKAGAYLYPDVFVTCDPRDRAQRLIKEHASLVVEVLSESTAEWDRDGKFALYRQLESLRAFVLISTDHRSVAVYERQEGPFMRFSAYGTGEVARIEALQVELYRNALIQDQTQRQQGAASRLAKTRACDPPSKQEQQSSMASGHRDSV